MKIQAGALMAMLATALALAGCGGSSDDNAAPTVNVTGAWRITPDGGIPSSVTLKQSGSSVQGAEPDGSTWAGSVSGDQLVVNVVHTDGTTVAAKATVSGNTMTGNYDMSTGLQGDFTATK